MSAARRVCILPDKFKGTLTAAEVAEAIARGWSRVRPQDRLELIPMSDGGDGFGETIAIQERGQRRRVKTVNAAGETIWSPWWWIPQSRTAVIETARVVGLAQLPKGKFHPFQLDTYGLGVLIAKILRSSVSTLLIGLGGSATNDGGFGMARALGWQFLNGSEKPIERWTDLAGLNAVVPPVEVVEHWEVIVAADVQNRLLGAKGASRIYGPQKGLRAEDMPEAEACLGQLAKCFRQATGRNEANRPGAGAAGGLGFGCCAFLGGDPRSGFEVFASRAQLDRRLGEADLIITGEGSVDRSSLMGKGVGEVAKWCLAHSKACVALGGMVESHRRVMSHFSRAYAMVSELGDEAQAFERPAQCLRALAEQAAREWVG
ncbi:MAG: Glycerate 2-kinase [Verrucomicrobia subdivision 3 bacterium]|nr:Glycerate 2-kinase [Limisphaerales bacterium]MCS1417534.1 Glycerate 2-kinase [Limisphaerales bacterium]